MRVHSFVRGGTLWRKTWKATASFDVILAHHLIAQCKNDGPCHMCYNGEYAEACNYRIYYTKVYALVVFRNVLLFLLVHLASFVMLQFLLLFLKLCLAILVVRYQDLTTYISGVTNKSFLCNIEISQHVSCPIYTCNFV